MPSKEAMQIAAQCWCDPRTETRVMDPDLAQVFAEKLDAEREKLVDIIELAWGLIANAYGGDWGSASEEWEKAAVKWRDEHWHPLLEKVTENSTEEVDNV